MKLFTRKASRQAIHPTRGAMTTNRQWLLTQRPEGKVGKHNFEYREVPVPELQDGEVIEVDSGELSDMLGDEG